MKKLTTQLQKPTRPQGPRIGPRNNEHHWSDWQKRHRAPRPIDLLRKIHEQRVKAQREEAEQAKKEAENLRDDALSIDKFDI